MEQVKRIASALILLPPLVFFLLHASPVFFLLLVLIVIGLLGSLCTTHNGASWRCALAIDNAISQYGGTDHQRDVDRLTCGTLLSNVGV